MDYADAKKAVISMLLVEGKAANSRMIEAIGHDTALFEKNRGNLIFEDIARDKNGAGLILNNVTQTRRSVL